MADFPTKPTVIDNGTPANYSGPMPPKNPQLEGIFICYRREDSIESAGRIFAWLDIRTDVPIFLDVRSLPGGADFETFIRQSIRGSRVVLVIIGAKWSSLADDAGDRRIDLADDPVQQEIAFAMQTNNIVIPVLVQNATMPSRTSLPPSIRQLANRQAISVRSEPYFDDDMRLLRQTLISYYPGQNVFHNAPAYAVGATPTLPISRQKASPPSMEVLLFRAILLIGLIILILVLLGIGLFIAQRGF